MRPKVKSNGKKCIHDPIVVDYFQILGTIVEFQEHIPIIQNLCNPGLRDRHWDQISEIVGFPLKPDKSMTVSKLIGFNLKYYIPQFEVISEAASKEYKLEKTLEKMFDEWSQVRIVSEIYYDLDKYHKTADCGSNTHI